MCDTSYRERRDQLETYFDRTAAEAWARLTADAPVSRIRATVRAGRDDMRAQLDRLVYRGFLHEIDWPHLVELPRYLKGMALRLDKLRSAAARDQQRMQEMADIQAQWLQRHIAARDKGVFDPRLDEIRWLIEELRVSLFAQALGTAMKVSPARVERELQRLRDSA